MAQKYYHNDYKKLLGVDETRTASEKLLDKAIGGFRPPFEAKEEKLPQKKVKEEHSSLTHSEVLAKVLKNIEGNSNAGKLIKPLSILKKCLGDKAFTSSADINSQERWKDILEKLTSIDDRLNGTYGEILPVNQALIQICTLLLVCLKQSKKSDENANELIKKQQGEVQIKKEQIIQPYKDDFLNVCEMQIMYYKLFTDDSFVFNKILAELKKKMFGYFQSYLQSQTAVSQNFLQNLSNLMIKLFGLPSRKYEWMKSSLAQFFKDFNIQYKQILSSNLSGKYLQMYNAFISQKAGHSGGEDVNFITGGSKGGKFTSVEVVKSDGFDKWASKQ